MKKNKSTFKAVSPDFKKLGLPILSLFGMLFCFLFATRIGFNQITDQRNKIDSLDKDITVLEKKLDSLTQVEQTLSNDVKFFSLALPDSNPVFSIIYQIKTHSASSELLVENIKGGAESKGKTYYKTDINFDLDGDLTQILSFLNLTQEFSPIVTLEKFKLTQGIGSYRASITLRGYWAPFPQKIPAVTQPISDFTEEEINMIVKISKLLIPPFAEVEPQINSERTNPFE